MEVEGGLGNGGKEENEMILKGMKGINHIWRQLGKLKINLAYFTVLPRAGLGPFISTT